jgi:glycosyltransferase involved in cell wall biosynthesis
MFFLRGSISDVENHYWNSYIYLHSAIDGIFGLSTFEALSSGLPLVANEGPIGDESFLKSEINGVLIKDNNLDDFVNGIKRIISDEDLFNRSSINNVNFAKQYSIEEYVQ